jgi:hypothetical protein
MIAMFGRSRDWPFDFVLWSGDMYSKSVVYIRANGKPEASQVGFSVRGAFIGAFVYASRT